MDTQTATTIKTYADRLLVALERIAAALEHDNAILDGPPVAGLFPPPLSAPAAPPASPQTPKESAPGPVFTFEQVKAAIMAYQDKAGWQAAQALMAKFGAKFIGQLKPEQFAEVMQALPK